MEIKQPRLNVVGPLTDANSSVDEKGLITVDTSSNAVTVYLSSEATTGVGGSRPLFIFQDVGGNAGTNNISVVDDKDNAVATVSSNYGQIFAFYDGQFWQEFSL